MSTAVANCHDAFFKRVLGEPGLAGTFLREHLPADVAELLGPELPEPVPGSFVDEELREHHVDQGPVPVDGSKVRKTLLRLGPKRSEKIMGWLTQPSYDMGKADGETRGEAKMLIRILRNKFGVVPETIRQRIFAANLSEIDSWGDRVCHAPDLQSVFDPN